MSRAPGRAAPGPPAPLDPAALARTLAPFPASARTLPAAAYTAPAVLDWEREHFFARSWVCAGRAADLPAPGDQRAVPVGGEGVLLVRGPDGVLRGFVNTCRHRAHELLPCDGAAVNARAIRCPYHRWTYALDGAFRGGPGMASQPGFDAADPGNALVGVQVAEWGGWVFVNASGDAPPLADHLGNLAGITAPYEPDRLEVAAGHDYELAANWKILVENYHECYHCTEIHPELCLVSPPRSGRAITPTGRWIGGSMDLVPGADTMSLSGRSDGVPLRGLDAAARRQVLYLALFPNLLLSLHPDYVMTHRLEPLAPDRTRVECRWLFPPEARDRPGFDPAYAATFWDLTNTQDWAACESVQRGAAGRGYRQSPFSEMEDEVWQFDAFIAQGYQQGRTPDQVPALPDPAYDPAR